MKSRFMRFGLAVGLISSSAFLFTFCSGDTPAYYDQYREVPGGTWEVGEKISYEVDITDTILPYHFLLNIRNSKDYRYRNLYLFVKTEFPNGKSSRDTVELVLAAESGRWTGDESASLYTSRHMIKFARVFPITGPYKFEVEHAMRDEELEGISDVGFRLVEAKHGE